MKRAKPNVHHDDSDLELVSEAKSRDDFVPMHSEQRED